MSKTTDQVKQKKGFFKELNIYYKVILYALGIFLSLVGIISIAKTLILYFSSSDIVSVYYTDILLAIFSLYYGSWLFGLSLDLKAEESTFFSTPNKGKISLAGQILMISLAALFGAIVILKGNIQYVSSLLFLFLVVNYIGWLYLKRFVESTIKQDLIHYKEIRDFIKYEKLVVVEEWLFGKWQTTRFALGFIFIIGINFYVYSPLYFAFPNFCDIQCVNYIPIILIALYIFIIEGIIIHYRLQRENSLIMLSDLDLQYSLVEKESEPV